MTIIFFLSEDYAWTASAFEKICEYFSNHVGRKSATIFLDKNRFSKEINEVVNSFKNVNDKMTVCALKYGCEEELKSRIENSDLILIDESRKREIAYGYIPYSYKGKFFFI